jgi:hypothetical protein
MNGEDQMYSNKLPPNYEIPLPYIDSFYDHNLAGLFDDFLMIKSDSNHDRLKLYTLDNKLVLEVKHTFGEDDFGHSMYSGLQVKFYSKYYGYGDFKDFSFDLAESVKSIDSTCTLYSSEDFCSVTSYKHRKALDLIPTFICMYFGLVDKIYESDKDKPVFSLN